jgi:hypothetical protein
MNSLTISGDRIKNVACGFFTYEGFGVKTLLLDEAVDGRSHKGSLSPRVFAGTDLMNVRISSGLPVTRQKPHHIYSIGALGVHLHVRTVGQGSLKARGVPVERLGRL